MFHGRILTCFCRKENQNFHQCIFWYTRKKIGSIIREMTTRPKYSSLLAKGITFCEDADSAIQELIRLSRAGNIFGLDTETKKLDPHTGKLRLVQISDHMGRTGV